MTDTISTDLRTVLRRLKLSRILDTLPERLALARQQQMPHQDLLLLVLQDEATRRDSQAAVFRAQKAQLDPAHEIERWDPTAKVTFDRQMLSDLLTLRFLDAHHHVAVVGPVGVGKTFLAHAIGHAACRRGHSVLAVRTDHMLKSLRQARLLNDYEVELRRLVSVDLLILDDFGLDAMDPQESRDAYEIFTERHRADAVHTWAHYAWGLDEVTWDWRTFGQYLGALRRAGHAINIAPLVGHGALRLAVVGFAERAVTAGELARMERHLDAAMRAGAHGMSSGLVYPPGCFASTGELLTLCRVVGRHHGI